MKERDRNEQETRRYIEKHKPIGKQASSTNLWVMTLRVVDNHVYALNREHR